MKKVFLLFALMAATLFGAQMVQARTINISQETVGYTTVLAQNGDELTGTVQWSTSLASNRDVIQIEANACVTLNSTNIETDGGICIKCLGDATIILKGSRNTITSGYKNAGIYVQPGYTLTIEGSGELTVTARGNSFTEIGGAAIGGDTNHDCGNIVINNGTITATGGFGCAGIGGGGGHACGDITIHGGTIHVTGGGQAAAIGSGADGSCGDITIDNEYSSLDLQATKGDDANHSIGAGRRGSHRAISICGTAYSTNISTSPFVFTTPKWDGDLSNVTAPVVAEDGVEIHGTLSTPTKISIAPQARVHLSNAHIRANGHSPSCEWAGLTCISDATIHLQGDNTVQGGYRSSAIFVPAGKSLHIEGSYGSLNAYARGQGAAIGAGYDKDCGNIYINNGTIEAHGGQYAAGIGGAFSADCGHISISECANVTAYKGSQAPKTIGAGFAGTDLGVSIGTSCYNYLGGSSSYDLTTSPFIYPEPEEPIEPEEPTCLVPTGLQQTGESEPYAVSVSWTQGGSETKWQVGWRLLGSTEDYSSYSVSHTSDIITGLTPDTDYEIAVRAQCDNWGNELSEWSVPIIVTTMALPQPCGMPRNLQTVSITENSITILFAPGSANNTEWEVACKIRATQQDVFRETGTDMIVTIPNLTPNTAYNIWVGAHCDEGSSDYNVLYNITTLEAEPEPEPEPCLAPTDVEVSNITSTSATVTFTPGSEDQTTWMVYCYIENQSIVYQGYIYENTATIENLQPNTEYKVTIKADCGEETSDWATDVPFTTLEEGVEPNPCLPVTNVIVSDITSTSAAVSFTPGSEDQTEWLVYCFIPSVEQTFMENVTETSVTIPDLQPNTEYKVMIKAFCGSDDADWSAEVPFTTLEDTGIEKIYEGQMYDVRSQKIIMDGHLFLLRPDGAILNASGIRVR